MGKRSKPLVILNICLTIVIILLIVAICIFVFVLSPMTVSGDSMLNTLKDGEKIWINKTIKDFSRGDIIVFKRVGHSENVVKRIIAMSGDTITFNYEDGYMVNGEVLDEPYIKDQVYPLNYFAGSKQDVDVETMLKTSGITLKEDELFVLGDNRIVSYDSHRYGPIKISEIKGKVL